MHLDLCIQEQSVLPFAGSYLAPGVCIITDAIA